MKTLLLRTATGIAYLLLLFVAFFVSDWILVTVFSLLLLIALFEYIRLAQKFPEIPNGVQKIFRRQILPLIWIVFPVLLLIYWCNMLNSKHIIVALLVILCTNDTLAYVFGSLFGKHKIWTKVSPKKSWEGFLGGLISTVAVSHFFIYIPYFQTNISSNSYIWMGFAFVVIITGTLGDFAESMVKRLAQQKDSGIILPGHGGVFDRIDSMLFAVPAGFIYWLLNF
ncbi:MAG: phosphatidate cytidylyltransferase [Bacteroidales bacterium]|jgi:phosphatidate cytidylyltransferase|nr:phosphatidate cytidylyltransferase [Bacteroidales bacterium]